MTLIYGQVFLISNLMLQKQGEVSWLIAEPRSRWVVRVSGWELDTTAPQPNHY